MYDSRYTLGCVGFFAFGFTAKRGDGRPWGFLIVRYQQFRLAQSGQPLFADTFLIC